MGWGYKVKSYCVPQDASCPELSKLCNVVYFRNELFSGYVIMHICPFVYLTSTDNTTTADNLSGCSSAAIPYPSLYGAQFLNLIAVPVVNYSVPAQQGNPSFPNNLTGLNFCNVSISYTHPGQNDFINVQIWLPSDDWNGLFMGVGGSGYATSGGDTPLGNGLSMGYSVGATDGGHELNSGSASSWALISPGNVNTYLLQDFAFVALKDITIIGKAVTESFYQKAPTYSYWNGCSTGGRQGLMMAQRYPEGYNGIRLELPLSTGLASLLQSIGRS